MKKLTKSHQALKMEEVASMKDDHYTISIQPEQRDNKHVELCDALFCLLSVYEPNLSIADQNRYLKFAMENNKAL